MWSIRNACLAIAALAMWAAASAQQAAPEKPASDPALQKQLLKLREQDQGALRSHLPEAELLEVQHSTKVALQLILRQHGWPRLSAVGDDAAQGAWLIVQHADDDLPWQREALAMMEALIPSGEVRKSDIAFLRDRIAHNEHRPQIYGTQGECVAKEEWKPFAMVDPKHVRIRRAEMDMISLDKYLTMTAWMCRKFEPASDISAK